jgi:L-rhamnose isomerase
MLKTKILKLKDLETKYSFANWIKESLEDFYKDKEVPDKHLLIFLDKIIENKAFKARDNDRVEWLKRIRKIKENIDVVERYNTIENPKI